jgi:demethylmenaquinone methyltransferase/2-methoxy-6-polyprenyl-1,4-benzoquinol methylase
MADSRLPLEASLDRPETKRPYVRRLFATIADRYDLITRLLSFGQDQRWKTQLVNLGGVRCGDRVLDLACGTGDIAFVSAARGAYVTGLDITTRMIELARAKEATLGGKAGTTPSTQSAAAAATNDRLSWLVGDMCALPCATASFDIVTTGYGLRNMPDLRGAIAEIHRVLKPGGCVLSLDFDRPETVWLRAIYLMYLTAVGSTLGWLLHRDPDTYRYIPESIRRYPGARCVAAMLTECRFSEARHISVLGGLMAIHVARKPLDLDSDARASAR